MKMPQFFKPKSQPVEGSEENIRPGGMEMLKEEIDAAVTSLNDFIDRFENASNLNGEAQLPIYRDLYNKYYGPYEIDGTEHVSVSDSLGLLEGTGEHSDLVIKFKVLFPFIRDKVLSGKYTPE